jgi:hypothetical protein
MQYTGARYKIDVDVHTFSEVTPEQLFSTRPVRRMRCSWAPAGGGGSVGAVRTGLKNIISAIDIFAACSGRAGRAARVAGDFHFSQAGLARLIARLGPAF